MNNHFHFRDVTSTFHKGELNEFFCSEVSLLLQIRDRTCVIVDT